MLTGSMALSRKAFASFFFSGRLDEARKAAYLRRLSGESGRAVREIFRRSPPQLDPDDWSIRAKDHERLRDAYAAELVVCTGGHDLMLEPTWEETAGAILDWLERRIAAGA